MCYLLTKGDQKSWNAFVKSQSGCNAMQSNEVISGWDVPVIMFFFAMPDAIK